MDHQSVFSESANLIGIGGLVVGACIALGAGFGFRKSYFQSIGETNKLLHDSLDALRDEIANMKVEHSAEILALKGAYDAEVDRRDAQLSQLKGQLRQQDIRIFVGDIQRTKGERLIKSWQRQVDLLEKMFTRAFEAVGDNAVKNSLLDMNKDLHQSRIDSERDLRQWEDVQARTIEMLRYNTDVPIPELPMIPDDTNGGSH